MILKIALPKSVGTVSALVGLTTFLADQNSIDFITRVLTAFGQGSHAATVTHALTGVAMVVTYFCHAPGATVPEPEHEDEPAASK